jgi:phosphoglycolate phosphatase
MSKFDRHLKTILFDFDGTLARLNIDFKEMRRSVLDIVTAYEAPADGLEGLFVLEMIEAGAALISRCRPGGEKAFTEEAMQRITAIEVEGAKSGGLLDGVRDMLITLRERNVAAGIVTRNCGEAVRIVFPDIHAYCDAVVSREMVTRVKPHREHLLLALKLLHSGPQEAAMVGDHPMDIRIGKDVGSYTVGVLTGYATADTLLEAGADLVIERATHIVRYLP